MSQIYYPLQKRLQLLNKVNELPRIVEGCWLDAFAHAVRKEVSNPCRGDGRIGAPLKKVTQRRTDAHNEALQAFRESWPQHGAYRRVEPLTKSFIWD